MLYSQDVARIMGEITKVHSVEFDKVVCHCPMARWEHSGGSDNSPSFAVMKGRTGWWVNCLACGYRNTLEGMIWDIMGRTKSPLTKIMALLYHKDQEDAVKSAPVKEIAYNPFGEYSAKNRPAFKRREYAQSVGVQTDLFGREVKAVAVEERPSIIELDRWESVRPPIDYVESRGITYEAYKEWRLGHDPIRRRLMFPVFIETMSTSDIQAGFMRTAGFALGVALTSCMTRLMSPQVR